MPRSYADKLKSDQIEREIKKNFYSSKAAIITSIDMVCWLEVLGKKK